MTCAAISQIAPASAALDGQHHPELNVQSDRSEPAESIGNGPERDGWRNTILSRSRKLRFGNDVQRQRFLAIHQTLSQHCCEGRA